MDTIIHTTEALDAQVGARPPVADLKVIDHLDAHALRWLAASPLAFIGFSDMQGIDATLAGGAPGFAASLDAERLYLPRGLLDHPGQALPGRGAGMLFLVPGLGETLRVNGVVALVDERNIVIEVQECYAHCAKALLRSSFWQPEADPVFESTADFIAACRFMALATADAGLRTDISPKGDPAGMLIQCDERGIRFADRPGNRRTDSFRNMLSRPSAASILMVPGSTQVAIVQGEVQLDSDPQLRQAFTVQDKTPKLVVSLATPGITLHESAALVRAAPWSAPIAPADIDPAEIFAAHIRLNKTRGLWAALAKRSVSIPGLMRKGLQQDYKRNMY